MKLGNLLPSSSQELQIYDNYMHDLDFQLVTESVLMDRLEDQINQLENTMKKYNLTLPKRPPKSTNTSSNTEAFTDRFIALRITNALQNFISLDIRVVRSSQSNDDLREMFKNFLMQEIDLLDEAINYVKLKGWIGTPPRYRNLPEETDEELNNGEAFSLWDHLITRYDGIEFTQLFSNYAHDPDFKTVLNKGLRDILEEQVNTIEEEMNRFGLSLPQRPAKYIQTAVNPEVIEDEIMYRMDFTLIQFMLTLHGDSFKQTITNDRLRTLHKEFLYEEIDILSKYFKYGNIKGWIRPAPMNKQSKE